MKIMQSKKKCQRPMTLPNKTNILKLSLKSKPRKRVKNKEIKNISQLVTSLGNTKLSYLDSPCGTIECVETDAQTVFNETQFIKETASFPDFKEDSQKRCSKPRRHTHKKQKSENNHPEIIIPSSSPKNSIVKMTCDTSAKNSGNTILQLCTNVRKKDSEVFSLFESLMLTGSEVQENTIKGAKAEKKCVQDVSVSRKNRKHSSIKTGKQSDKDEIINIKVHDCPNSPVCSLVVNSNGTNSVANFYELGYSKFLVLLKPESSLAVIGTVEIQLLKGSFEVLGYESYKEDEKLLIFSLHGSSHLSLKAKGDQQPICEQKSTKTIREKLIALGLPEKLSLKVSKKAEKSVLFTVTRDKNDVSSTVWPKFFENHSSYSIFPNTNLFNNAVRPCHIVERKIKCLFETNLQELGLKEFSKVPDWSAIKGDIVDQDYPKAIFCGGKSVGKSSLLRYLVNKCLFKWKQILVLDFDLGQCEFTVPGCISATLVEEPLLGPNYSHLKKPKRSVFLGEVDVTKCPENYIEGCKSLIDYARHKHSDIPWLINTMGFTRGFGISLACGIISYVSPTHVIQIQSRDRDLNFPSLLEPKYVYCLKHSAFDDENNRIDYQLYTIPSGSEKAGFISKSRGMSPAESRSLVILSYMSRMLNSNTTRLSQVIPYMISMEQLDLQTTNQYNLTKAQVAATMNGNMVALCHKMPSKKIPNCRGFGIIRAVDWQKEMLYLITPLPPNELSKVNCLLKGNVGLPDSLHYNQGDQVTGHMPYLAHTSGGFTARFAKRDFRNLPVTQKDNRQYR